MIRYGEKHAGAILLRMCGKICFNLGVKFEDFVWGGVGIFWSDIMVLGEIDILVKYFGEIWWSIWMNYYGAIFDMFWWGIMVRYYGEIIWRDIMVSYYGEIFRWGIMVRYYGELRERGVLAAFPTNSVLWHPPIKVSACDQDRGDDDLNKSSVFYVMMPYLRHWLQFWQLRTWIHDNLCDLTIKSDTGQHS